MHFLIDESISFIFNDKPENTLGVALVAGVMLPYDARREYLKKYGKLKKHTREDLSFLDTFLNDLISWNVQGTLIIGDRANVSKQDAEKFRRKFLETLYRYADKETATRKQALYLHLDNLAGNGDSKLSLQDFFKILTILETIAELVRLYLKNISNIRSLDIRKIKLIIDDQCKAGLMTLKEGFIHFFLNCRAQEGKFTYQFGASSLFEQLYINPYESKSFLDTTKLLKNILVLEKGKMDDQYPELKIADILANTTTKLFKGKISEEITKKLLEIFKFRDACHFNSELPHLDVTIPEALHNSAISRFLAQSVAL